MGRQRMGVIVVFVKSAHSLFMNKCPQCIHKWIATKEKHREKEKSSSLASALPQCASRPRTEHSPACSVRHLRHPAGIYIRAHELICIHDNLLNECYTCSSKLQHAFFPISVRSILCEMLFYGPCLLILWAWLRFSNHCFEVILFETPFPLPTLLLQDVNNFNEKCTSEVVGAPPGKPQTSLRTTDPLSGWKASPIFSLAYFFFFLQPFLFSITFPSPQNY